ncbi:histidine kinase [Thiohalorhabdus denitrificans]|uniref:Two-component system, NtrC family, response regulator HydG n=1 Tax=Thiohalorhabdus denitrificans TaxID=381306 RepID=A0A0P9C5T1_9GAMM|nr:sigma-54 dependent transcriptional regulator [Thiohalorhabdus denitrificans]KPV40409.1 histidine kinase [Thiohalorhabdus denitrificans]SCY59959.1 two-component system, NtrC family, response regulator HydG [Thiohalorhabdus denitrificans]
MSAEHARILFVDDDPVTCTIFERFCEDRAYAGTVLDSAEKAVARFRQEPFDLVVTDLRMPGMDGLAFVRALKEHDPEVAVLVVTGYSSVENAVESIKAGALDFIKKPFDLDELGIQIEQALQQVRLVRENSLLKRRLRDEQADFGMVGSSPAMEPVFERIRKVADIPCNVLITGESGTGKELVARALHDAGERAEQPFVVIDCGALTDTLLESELFGHEKGAFTGANARKRGLLESAQGGTVFLDEICNISDAMQMKLLRVLQEQQVTRVGGVQPQSIDARFVVATNRDLAAMVEAGEFRHDLYHRLNVVGIELPPLRRRTEDIPALTRFFVQEVRDRYGRQVEGFTAEALGRLTALPWPGNLRELRNLVERCVVLADSPWIGPDLVDQLIEQSETEAPSPEPAGTGAGDPDEGADLPLMASLEEVERRHILRVLEAVDGHREQAARILGVNKTTLWRKLKRFAPGEKA